MTLGLAVASAEPFKLCSSFGATGTAPGQFSGESPTGIAANTSTGAVYAYDDGTDKRVEKFSPQASCKYGAVTTFTGSETPAGAFAEEGVGLAVDNSSGPNSGDVYVVDTGHSVVDRFSAAGTYLGQIAIAFPNAVAVDSGGNVYVTSFVDADVHAFNSSGSEVHAYTGSLLSSPFGVAVDAQGNLYVVNLGSNVVKLTISGGSVVHESVFDSHQPNAVATDTSGRVYVFDNEGGAHVTVYSTHDKEIETFGSGEIGGSLALAFGPVGSGGGLYVADLSRNEVEVFEQGEVKALPEPPEISACHATGITRSSAEVGCTINPQGPKAEWHLEYGETGSATMVEVPGGEVSTSEAVLHTLSSLKPATRYTFKLIASNANGTAEEESTFTTSPAVSGVTKCHAAAVDGVQATLEGSLEPEGEATSWHFEYGLTTSYGTSSPDEQSSSASVLDAQSPTAELEGNVTYHCRLVAANAFGTTDGQDGTFVTPLVEPQVNLAAPSASVTRTTALLRGTVNPENSPTQYHFQYVEAARYQGSAANPYAEGGETPSASAGGGFGQVAVGPQSIEGLRPGTEYHYRLVAANQANAPGVSTDGEDHIFTTASRAVPHATVGGVSEIGQTTATIFAAVTPSGLASTYQFEVGRGTGFEGAPIFGSAGDGESPEAIQAQLQGLIPGTTYEFRVTVRNADGQETSGVQTFTTLSVSSPIAEPPIAPLLAVPPLLFPATESTTSPPPKSLTRAQQLAKALKACAKKPKGKRAACRRQARRRYGPIKKRG
jgi:sugar lactone lactonase YvrE